MRNKFEAVDERRAGAALRALAAAAWLLLLSALLSGQEQQSQESTTVPAATFQWTGNPGTDRASVRTECATADVPVADCEATYEGLRCVFVELERALRRPGADHDGEPRRSGPDSERLTTGDGGGAWTMEVEGDRLDTFPFIDFEEDVVGVFVNGDFLTCAEDC